jgi:D-amino-acid dehydrogenase
VPDAVGALYSPTCQTGSSALFATRLAAWAEERLGLKVDLGRTVTRIVTDRRRVRHLDTNRGTVEADAFVLAAGAEAGRLGEAAGLRLPIYPVKGYSVTLPIQDPGRIPRRSIVDEDRLIAITPMGERLRASASAVFGGFDRSHRPEDFAGIRALLGELFGDAVDWGGAVYWAGFRPMTPPSVPILGASPLANLFLNVGHGHVGWSMAAGSARVVADIVAGRATEIGLDGLTYR